MVMRTKVTMTGVPGSPYLSVMHWIGSDQTDADGAIAAVAAFWTELEPIMSSDLDWVTEPDVEVLNSATGVLEDVFSVTSASGSGNDTVERISPATQGLIRWRTGAIENGREVRGRTFVPGITVTGNDDGQPNASFTSNANSAISEILGGATPLAIWHRPNDEGPGAQVTVVSGSPWTQWAVLRSRRD